MDEQNPTPGEQEDLTPDELKQQVKVVIEISADKVEAFLTLMPLTESPGFSAGEIIRALSEKGVIYGIKKELPDILEREPVFEEKLLIASGTRPAPAKDGALKCFFEENRTVAVAAGDKIAEIINPVQGEEGIDVFSEKIAVREPKAARIPNLVNAGFSPENENLLISEADGYLFYDRSTCAVTPFFELEVSGNEYEAYVKVAKPLDEGDFSSSDLEKFLEGKGIVFGVLDKEIENLFREEKFGERVLIARGKAVEDETDGDTRYYFDTELKPRIDEDGQVNFWETNLIQSVKKGDKLVEVTLPGEGVAGRTVSGREIPPKKGVKPSLPVGKNAQPDPENPDVLVSEINGNVRLKGNIVEVDPTVVIKGDLDFSTGNIDCEGSVIIGGDVRSGFRIKTVGDLEVNGVVEDAVIEAGGDVLLKTGFVGKGEGELIALGEVTLTFCENQSIVCDGDLSISEYLMHSTVRTSGRLVVTGKKGIIVGGEACAAEGVEANVIGNQNQTPTSIVTGQDKKTLDEISEKRAALEEHLDHIKRINNALSKISRRQLIKKALPADKQSLGEQLNQVKDEKTEVAKALIDEIEELDSRIGELKKALVKVYDVVYPGTSITISDRQLTVEQPLKCVYFKYAEEEVTAADLEELGDSPGGIPPGP
ncbi:MAG: FapA family protein [Gemmatimonadota bacterium]|nr:FapA family protein [Gemmatimonadota bacterium]